MLPSPQRAQAHSGVFYRNATIRAVQILDYITLGVVQGLTEFLPVSSSAHLVLAEHWIGLNPPGVILEIALHVATLLSVVIVYARDLWNLFAGRNWRYFGFLFLATCATVAIVFPARDYLSQLTDSPQAVRICGALLLFTAAWLWFADWRLRRGPNKVQLSWLNSLLIGLAQGIAGLPGVSRSGATIGAGIQAGLTREDAARFSFLLSIPIIIGAAALKAKELKLDIASGAVDTLGLALAFIAAALTGVAAIYLLLWMLKRARLLYFALYCAALAVIALIVG
jgi:undecaprenyl-diphosphatase